LKNECNDEVEHENCTWSQTSQLIEFGMIDHDPHNKEWSCVVTVNVKCVLCGTEKTVCFSGEGDEV